MRNCYLFFLIALLFSPVNASAGGFLIYNQDAAATSMGLAYTAQVQNPSAVLYNPAAINQLKGTQCYQTLRSLYQIASFRGASSGKKPTRTAISFSCPPFLLQNN